ncbi:MAG: hypothetical protein KC619_33245 [Myxococcales bacterium]|nr:hypothetical protein [Myxococcales bacterium]
MLRWVWLALLVIGCGETQRVSSIAPEEAAEEVVAAEREVADDPPTDAPPSADLAIEQRTLPASTQGAAFPYEVPRHPSASVRTRLAEFLTALARETQRHAYEDASCRVLLARPEIVSVICRGRYAVRDGQAIRVLPAHFAIVGDDVEPFAVEEAFVADADLVADIVARCRAELPGREGRFGCYPNVPLSLGPRGVIGQFVPRLVAPEVVPIELEYDAVRERVRPGGPLAAMLGVEGEAPPSAETGAFVVSPARLSDDVLAAYSALPRELAGGAGIRLQALGPAIARLVTTSGGRPLADRIAASLGTEARPLERLDAATLSTLHWARATGPLRVTVDGSFHDILPEGSIVLTIGEHEGGPFDPIPLRSALGSGHDDGSDLERYSGCIPAPPEGFGAAPLIAITRAHVGRRERDVVLFARTGADETRIAIHDLRVADCAVGPERAALTAAGGLFDLQLQQATEGAGPTLVVVGTMTARDQAHYRVRELGADHDAWEHDIATRVGVGYMVWLGFRWRQGGWMPVSYQLGGPTPFHGLRWVDGALEDVGPVDQ